MFITRLRPVLFLPLFISLAAGAAAIPLPAQAAASCSAFSSRIYDRVNPSSRAQLLTRSASESSTAFSRGFTHDRGYTFKVAASAGAYLRGVHRLRHYSSGDLFYSLDRAEIIRATSSYGYRDEGVKFYAATSQPGCLMPVTDYFKGGLHRFVTRSSEAAALRANGWSRGRVRFYVGRPPADPKFTLGVIPDTQQEVVSSSDPRFRNRTQWLATNRSKLDLRYVAHVGDVVNWNSEAQYLRAESAMRVLNTARVPYSISPGNHDNASYCTGGGLCDGSKARAQLRDTRLFNRYLNDGTNNLGGRYESGKVDNTFSTFAAGGLQWLVLNIEVWPRPGAVTWARRVVARHPRHNVIVVSHAHLSWGGGIYTSAGFGDTSARSLFDQLIGAYPNVRMVLSGHAGNAFNRVDRGRYGNLIYTMQLNMDRTQTNPLRLIDIDTAGRTLSTRVYAPYTRTSYPSYGAVFRNVSWVR